MMQGRNLPWRRLAFALAVPAVAIGAIALTAGTASATGAPAVAQSEQPNQPNQQPNHQPMMPNHTGNAPGTNIAPPRTLMTVPTSPPRTSPATKSPNAKPSTSPSPSPSPVPGGGVTLVPVPVPVPGGAGAGCTAPMTPPVTVKIGTVGGKQALVNQAGCAIYMNNKDTATASVCGATCLQTFHIVPGPAQPGSGVDRAKLNVFKRTDGTVQATYGGHQLYTFTGDTSPGEANGQRLQQTWFLLAANGNPITS
jgi:predicted lipoprotein with Yx(FWY)xxD motif